VLLGLQGEIAAYLHDAVPDLPPAPLIHRMLDLVRRAESDGGLTDLGGWTTRQVDTALRSIDDPIEQASAEAALGLLLTFLQATGRWNGDLAVLDRIGTSMTTAMADQLRTVAEQYLQPSAEAAALAEDTRVIELTAFLRWLGVQPRPVTATGVLRTADTAAVIAALDLAPQPGTVTSMWDHPELCTLWETARRTGAIVVADGRVGVAPLGVGLVDGDPAAARTVVSRAFVHAILQPVPGFFPDGLRPGDVAEAALACLTGTGPPVPAAASEEPISPKDLGLALSISRPGDDPAEREALAITFTAQALLRSGGFTTTAAGLLGIVPGLEALVLSTLADLLDGTAPVDGGTLLGAARLRGAVAHGVDDITAAAVRLTATLLRSRPRVWATVEIAAGSTLADLHALLVAAFGRFDDHLHEFIAVDPFGLTARYTADEDGQDEAAITVLDVLGRAATLEYVYDLGAEWRHQITLDAVVPLTTHSPRVVAAGGRAPGDDG
jgi:hypothetical protein